MEDEPKREPNRLANCVWIFLFTYACGVFISLQPNVLLWEESNRLWLVTFGVLLSTGYLTYPR